MAGKEASFARLDSRDPLSSSAETTPDFDALERAAESIRPAWDGVAAPLPSVPPPAPVPVPMPVAASPSAADSTHRMRAQLAPSAQLDDLDDLTLPKKGRSWLAPAVIGGIVVVGLAAMFLGSSEPAAPTPEAAPVVASAAPAQPSAPAIPAPSAAPTPVEPVAEAPVVAPEVALPAPAAVPAPVVEKLAEPAVDRLAAARAKRREKRPAKPVLAKPIAAKPVLAKKAEPVRKPAAPAKPAEVKPRKGVGFVSDNPY